MVSPSALCDRKHVITIYMQKHNMHLKCTYETILSLYIPYMNSLQSTI